ncbi:hypothetical protein GUK30_20280 [Rhizobium leguminosarum]|uniref:VOC family protein n=1 Tax=Rhizobium ruizarguesonis TaxID=2081791 RepID=UPI0013C1F064|nr:VOC family protein [Rhizobium ruizarguesonis]NEI21752.1 hypothetical protein [Rhizobium ruizarguesonis]
MPWQSRVDIIVWQRSLSVFRLPLSALFQLSSVELFEYSGEEDSRPKRLSEVGGMHLCFEVDDVHACAERLRAQGVDMLDGPNLVESGPLRGFNWIYFRSPWGLMLEAASFNRLGYESNSSHRLWSAKPV